MPVEIRQHSKYYYHMNYSFEYIDIILLAMIAGFIFLRLRGILGKKSGFEEDIKQSFPHEPPIVKTDIMLNGKTKFQDSNTIINSLQDEILTLKEKMKFVYEKDEEIQKQLQGKLGKQLVVAFWPLCLVFKALKV